jgi:hypothetical protein
MPTRSLSLDGIATDGGPRAFACHPNSSLLTESSQYVLHDPVISNKHLRIYSVAYECGKTNDVAPLVYAEDLSRNGTFWNGSLIGKGNGGFLLSDNDTLRVSARILFVFRTIAPHEEDGLFDLTQEREMKVGLFHRSWKSMLRDEKEFCKDYIVTDRVLGAGAHGRVHMAIKQVQRKQLACKIVDLRKPSRTSFGRWERPAAAEKVDSRIQLAKVKSWVKKWKKDNQVEEKLKAYYREAFILSSLKHVSCSPGFEHSSSVIDSRAAQHYRPGESLCHRQ